MLKARTDPVLREYVAAESFDASQYLGYLRRRFRFILAVSAAAAVVVLIVSLLLPKQYTATASILIEPPAGGDPRSSVAVNPTYLESLRSYELFASGDTLFARALDKFHLRDPRTPIESVKRRVLKVTKVRDTKILEIAVTLPEANKAQVLAQFLAEETVNLNRSSNHENDRDLLDEPQKLADEARSRFEREQAAWREFNVREPLESLRVELDSLNSLRKTLRENLVEAKAALAEYSGASDARMPAARGRVASLENQDAELARQIDAKAPLLAQREARAEELERSLHSAQGAYDTANVRLRDLHAGEGQRGERLRVIDPGVVPERPSFPNVGLNVALALAVALIACITYLTLTFRPLTHDRNSQV